MSYTKPQQALLALLVIVFSVAAFALVVFHGRYQIASAGDLGVWRIDTTTGQVSFCYRVAIKAGAAPRICEPWDG